MNIITHVQDGKLRMAVVNEDQLDELAQIRWPDGYGIREAATLGTNLLGFLNGAVDAPPAKRAAVKQSAPKALPAARPEAAVSLVAKGNALVVKDRSGKNAPQSTIKRKIAALVLDYPEGLTTREVADVLAGGRRASDAAARSVTSALNSINRDNRENPGMWPVHSELEPGQGRGGEIRRMFPGTGSRPERPVGGARDDGRFSITADMVAEILARHPDGLRSNQVASEVWAKHGDGSIRPEWARKNTANALMRGAEVGLIRKVPTAEGMRYHVVVDVDETPAEDDALERPVAG